MTGVFLTSPEAPYFQENGSLVSGYHVDRSEWDFQAPVTELKIKHEVHSRRPPASLLPGPGRIETADWMQQLGPFLLLKQK